jgi:hypothetical protein
MDKNSTIVDVIGWYGTVAILGSFALVSFNVISATGLVYQVLNLTGGLGLLTISLAKGVKQSVAVNAFWALIALIALIKLIVT